MHVTVVKGHTDPPTIPARHAERGVLMECPDNPDVHIIHSLTITGDSVLILIFDSGAVRVAPRIGGEWSNIPVRPAPPGTKLILEA